jgi:hypothetical protein
VKESWQYLSVTLDKVFSEEELSLNVDITPYLIFSEGELAVIVGVTFVLIFSEGEFAVNVDITSDLIFSEGELSLVVDITSDLIFSEGELAVIVGVTFVLIFSEGELEEVLTTYTKINKSASIFLGGHPKNTVTDSNGQSRPTSTFQHSRPPSGCPARTSSTVPNRPPVSRQSSILQNRPGSGSLARSSSMSTSDPNVGKKKDSEAVIEVAPKTINGWEDTPKFGTTASHSLHI